MTAAILALKLVPLLLICSLAPGLLIVRSLRWSPLEKLCGAMAASFVLTYLASFILFILNASPWAYWLTSGAFFCMGAMALPQLRLLLKARQTRTVLITFAIVLAWDFLHLAIVQNYGGGTWYGDWREHFDRTRFFLHLIPADFKYLDVYPLPARPPMMNLLCAFFCRQVGMSFEAYSLCCLFLNAFAFVPCCLLLRMFNRRGAAHIPVLAVLFMLNPSIMQNVTWTITKAFAAAFVILGVAFYLRGLRSKEPSRIIASAICLAAAVLVHYSALPFAAAIALHYLWRLLRGNRMFPSDPLAPCTHGERVRVRGGLGEAPTSVAQSAPHPSPVAGSRHFRSLLPGLPGRGENRNERFPWKFLNSKNVILEPLCAGLSAIALLSTWFAWSTFFFGMHATFFSNTTATGTAAKTLSENLQKVGLNIFTSIVPHPLHPFATDRVPPMENLGYVRDYFFMIYQTTLPFMIGSAGGIIVIYLLMTRLRASKERSFWIFFILFTFIVGIAVNPETEVFGCAHVTLQPLALMGVTLVSAWLASLSLPLFRFAILGLALDYILGILLHFERESHVFATLPDPVLGKKIVMDTSLGSQAFLEYAAKLSQGYVFWGDHFAPISSILKIASALIAVMALLYLLEFRARQPRRLFTTRGNAGARQS